MHIDGDREVTDKATLADVAVNYYTNLFCFVGSNLSIHLAEDFTPHLVTDVMNNMLTISPSKDEIQSAVFILKKNSAPGPDEFGGIFYHTY